LLAGPCPCVLCLFPSPQPWVFLAQPAQQVGVDARQEGIQRRRVEGTVVVHPAPHDRVDPPCEVRFGETSSFVQPPGPHYRADLVQGVLADRRDETGRDPPASRPDSPAPEPVPQERERGALMRAAPPATAAWLRSAPATCAPAQRPARRPRHSYG